MPIQANHKYFCKLIYFFKLHLFQYRFNSFSLLPSRWRVRPREPRHRQIDHCARAPPRIHNRALKRLDGTPFERKDKAARGRRPGQHRARDRCDACFDASSLRVACAARSRRCARCPASRALARCRATPVPMMHTEPQILRRAPKRKRPVACLGVARRDATRVRASRPAVQRYRPTGAAPRSSKEGAAHLCEHVRLAGDDRVRSRGHRREMLDRIDTAQAPGSS